LKGFIRLDCYGELTGYQLLFAIQVVQRFECEPA
jgi:hypothetical protein